LEAGDIPQVVELTPSKHAVLSSNPITTKKKKGSNIWVQTSALEKKIAMSKDV
jgi:hypothetical protein